MRIQAYNQIAQVYNTSKAYKPQRAQAAEMKDQLHISSFGQAYQLAKQAVAGASDVREDKVAMLKQSVDSGSYNVSSDELASHLLEKYSALA